jgi:hypothetical protein
MESHLYWQERQKVFHHYSLLSWSHSTVKHAASKKGHVEAFGGVVTQRKTQSLLASPERKVNAEKWANMCDEEAQEEYMHSNVNILMEVYSAEADSNQ